MITQKQNDPLWKVTIQHCTSSKLEDHRQTIDDMIFLSRVMKATHFGEEQVITAHGATEKEAADYVLQQNPLAKFVKVEKVA